MIKYIDSNTIDFIEYREMKKGIDINLYMEMDMFSFVKIYERTAIEIDHKFNELIELDKKLTALNRKNSLTHKETILYDDYVNRGQIKYERYSFLEDKIAILDKVRKNKGWKLFDEIDCDFDIHGNDTLD